MSILYFQKKFKDLSKKDVKKIEYGNKEIDFEKYPMSREEYAELTCNIRNLDEFEKLETEIYFLSTPEYKLWSKILSYTSSVKTIRTPGKNISYFVRDKETQKVIGLVSLGSAQRSIKPRDDYIGWDKDNQYAKIDYIFNISTCVAVQPIGFNFNIGKLLALSVFSREVQEKIKEKYGHYAIGYYTFSIHGRSIQYERLKKLVYCGLTKGQSFIIPDVLYEECKDFLREIGIFSEISNKAHLKKIVIQKMLEELMINPEDIYHNLQRGIYCGFCFKNSKELLCNGSVQQIRDLELSHEVETFQNIFEFWKIRWARQRFNHLILTKRVKHALCWSKLDEVEKNRIAQRKYQEKKREELGEEEYKKIHNETAKKYYVKKEKLHLQPEYFERILEYKKEMTAKDVVDVMKIEIPNLTENKVKKIWCGLLREK